MEQTGGKLLSDQTGFWVRFSALSPNFSSVGGVGFRMAWVMGVLASALYAVDSPSFFLIENKGKEGAHGKNTTKGPKYSKPNLNAPH